MAPQGLPDVHVPHQEMRLIAPHNKQQTSTKKRQNHPHLASACRPSKRTPHWARRADSSSPHGNEELFAPAAFYVRPLPAHGRRVRPSEGEKKRFHAYLGDHATTN